MTQRAECTDPNCSIAITHYVDEHERSSVARGVVWHEQRHIQLARRMANLRRNIRQLQRAFDRQSAIAQNHVARWREQMALRYKERAEMTNLHRLDMARVRANRNRHLAIAFALGAAIGILVGGLMR
jgi:hypothetical protein